MDETSLAVTSQHNVITDNRLLDKVVTLMSETQFVSKQFQSDLSQSLYCFDAYTVILFIVGVLITMLFTKSSIWTMLRSLFQQPFEIFNRRLIFWSLFYLMVVVIVSLYNAGFQTDLSVTLAPKVIDSMSDYMTVDSEPRKVYITPDLHDQLKEDLNSSNTERRMFASTATKHTKVMPITSFAPIVNEILPEIKAFKAVYVVYDETLDLITRFYCQMIENDASYHKKPYGLHLAKNSIWRPTRVHIMSPNISWEKRERISRMISCFEHDLFMALSLRTTNIVTDKLFDSSSSEINDCRRDVCKVGFDITSLSSFDVIRYVHMQQMSIKCFAIMSIFGTLMVSLELAYKAYKLYRVKRSLMRFVRRNLKKTTRRMRVVRRSCKIVPIV